MRPEHKQGMAQVYNQKWKRKGATAEEDNSNDDDDDDDTMHIKIFFTNNAITFKLMP
jgi:hypothetical protein